VSFLAITANRARLIGLSLGLAALGFALFLLLGPRLPTSCATSPTREPGIQFALTPANHDCSYSVHVGQRFTFDAPGTPCNAHCGLSALDVSDPSLVFVEIGGISSKGSRHDVVLARAPGTTRIEPYRITIQIDY
jgi:hypothetical protein